MSGTVFYRHRDGSRCRHPRAGRGACPGGSWSYVVDLPTWDGKRRQKKQGGFATRQAAVEASQQVRGAIEAGEGVATGTVGAFRINGNGSLAAITGGHGLPVGRSVQGLAAF